MRRCLIALCIFLGIVLSGCSEIAVQHQRDQLEQTLYAYQKMVRWNEFETAARFQKPGSAAPPANRDLTNIRVTSYEVVAAPVSTASGHAQQTVQIRYYHQDSAVEKTITDRQEWSYDSAAKRWYLTTGLPAFK